MPLRGSIGAARRSRHCGVAQSAPTITRSPTISSCDGRLLDQQKGTASPSGGRLRNFPARRRWPQRAYWPVGSNFSPLWYTAKHSKRDHPRRLRAHRDDPKPHKTRPRARLCHGVEPRQGRDLQPADPPTSMGRRSTTSSGRARPPCSALCQITDCAARQQLPAYLGHAALHGRSPPTLGAAAIFSWRWAQRWPEDATNGGSITACIVMILLAMGPQPDGIHEFAFRSSCPVYNKFHWSR